MFDSRKGTWPATRTVSVGSGIRAKGRTALGAISIALAVSTMPSCSSDSTGSSPSLVPTTVTLTGNAQTGTVGATLVNPIGVTILDQNGAGLAGVSVAFAVTAGGGSVGASSVTSNAQGVANTNWTLGTTAGSNLNAVGVTVPGFAGSLAAVVATGTAGVATLLQVVTQPPATAQSGVALGVQPAVRLSDAYANPVTTSGIVVTAQMGVGTGALGGALTATTANGVATFTDLAITGGVGVFTVRFTSGTLTEAVSNAITLGAGPAAKLVLVVQPSATAQNAIALAQQPQVQIQDASGNAVASAVPVTATIQTGGGTIGGTTTVTANGALATFSSLLITGTIGTRTLSFTATGLTSTTSGSIVLAAGTPTQIAMSAGDAQTATAGTPVTTPPTVRVHDVSDNPVPGVDVTFAVVPGVGSVVPVVPVATSADGIATATSWTLGPVAGANSLTATAASGGIAGNPVTFVATGTVGAATRMLLNDGNNQTAIVNSPVTIAPSVKVTDAVGNGVSGVGVTFAISSGGGTLTGASQLTDASGIARVVSWTVGSVAGPNDLSVTAVGVLLSGDPITISASAKAAGVWTTKAPMSVPRSGVGAGVLNGLLYVVGGFNLNYLGTLEVYDPSSDTWATKSPMPTPRLNLGAAALNGLLYAVGGANSNGQPLGTVEAYDPATDSWSTKTSLPTPRSGLGVVAVNGVLYAVGGYAGTNLSTVEAYDPQTNSWSTKSAMPSRREIFGIAVVADVVYAVGGSGEDLVSVEAYDPATDNWSIKTSMPIGQYGLSAGAIAGVLYATGGVGVPQLSYDPVQAYNPVTDSWSLETPMAVRYYPGLGVVNGIMYVVGGSTPDGFVGTTEAFVP